MTQAVDVLAARIEKVETKADHAFDHALDLHEKLGKLGADSAAHALKTQSVAGEVAALRAQVRALDKRVADGFRHLERTVRKELESVPELVEEEITAHGTKAAAKSWRSLTRNAKAIAVAILTGLALGAGATAHWLVETVLHH